MIDKALPFRLYIRRLKAGERGNRHEREEAAVAVLVAEAFGPDARRLRRDDGSPYIEIAGQPVEVTISISHSTHYAALAVGRGCTHLGIDIEEKRAQLLRVLPRMLSATELAEYGGSMTKALKAWTLKEALYKACRHAMNHEPDWARELNLPVAGLRKAITAEMEFDIHFEEPDCDTRLCVVWA